MIKATLEHTIIAYEPQDDYVKSESGIAIPTELERRRVLRKDGNKTFDADDPPPDIIREGIVEDSKTYAKGTKVFFNKHDGYQVIHEEKIYYSVQDKLILAYVE